MQLVPRQSVTRIAVGMFLPWYFVEVPVGIVCAYGAYARAFWEIFSFPFLLRTLLKPWKNVVDAYPKNHFDLSGIFQAWVMNCMSRIIGCIFRIFMMILGVVTHVVCLAVFLVWLTVWMTFPFLLLLGSAYLLHTIYT